MRRYFQKKFCCVESNVVLGFKGLKWELSHISLKELLNQSLVENGIPVRPKLEGKEPQSALFAAQNCPASQRALKKPPWGEFHMEAFVLWQELDSVGKHYWTRNRQEQALQWLWLPLFSLTLSQFLREDEKAQWQQKALLRKELRDLRKGENTSSTPGENCCDTAGNVINKSLCCIFASWTVLCFNGSWGRRARLGEVRSHYTTLNSLPFRALQWAFKPSSLLFSCPFSQPHQILSRNCICSLKIFLAVLSFISPPGTKKFCKPAVKMKRLFAFYHTMRKVLIFLCCFENCKHMGIWRCLKNIRMTRKMQTILIRSNIHYIQSTEMKRGRCKKKRKFSN